MDILTFIDREKAVCVIRESIELLMEDKTPNSDQLNRILVGSMDQWINGSMLM